MHQRDQETGRTKSSKSRRAKVIAKSEDPKAEIVRYGQDRLVARLADRSLDALFWLECQKSGAQIRGDERKKLC